MPTGLDKYPLPSPDEKRALVANLSRVVPSELRELAQWVVWKALPGNPKADGTPGKVRKVPYSPTSHRAASSTDAQTWGGFDKAISAFWEGDYNGVGLVLVQDGELVALDLDDVIYADGGLMPQAKEIIDHFASHGYVEMSPSKRGVRVILRGSKKGHRSVKAKMPGGWHLEVFEGARYVTITGYTLPGYEQRAQLSDSAQRAIDRLLENTFGSTNSANTSTYVAPQNLKHNLSAPNLTVEEISRRINADPVAGPIFRGEESSIGDGRSDADASLFNVAVQAAKGNLNVAREVLLNSERGNIRAEKWSRNYHLLDGSEGDFLGYELERTWATFQTGRLRAICDPRAEAQAAFGPVEYVEQIRTPNVNSSHTRGFELKTLAELRRNPAKRGWTIKGYLPCPATGCVHGVWGTKKTFVVIDMLLHIAAGLDWRGSKTAQGPVVFCPGEGEAGILARAEGWCQAHDVIIDDLPFVVAPSTPFFSDAAHMSVVKERLANLEAQYGAVRAVAIDTLARSTPGLDENSARDMGLLLDRAAELTQRFQCTTLFIHHSGHQEQGRGRGSSALAAGWDFSFSVKAIENTGIRLICSKMKDAREPGDLAFSAREVGVGRLDDDGLPITTLVLDSAALQSKGGQKPLKGNKAIAMQAIEKLHAGQNEPVSVEEWFERASEMGFAPGAVDDRNRKTVFGQVTMQLLDDARIAPAAQGFFEPAVKLGTYYNDFAKPTGGMASGQ